MKRGQLPIGVQNVELHIVLAEGGAGISRDVGDAIAVLVFSEDQLLNDVD